MTTIGSDPQDQAQISGIDLSAISPDQIAMVVPGRNAPVTFDDLRDLEEHIHSVIDSVRSAGHSPTGMKTSPRINATQLAKLCRKSNTTMLRLLDRAAEFGLADGHSPPPVEGEDPTPTKGAGTRQRRMFTLQQAIDWIRHVGPMYRRPNGAQACTLAVGNFKGGVGKTVMATCVAQGLSLMGYRVLCIDLDPQGSMTSLFDIDRYGIEDSQTFLPLALRPSDPGYRDSLQESIQETYWYGCDIVAGNSALFGGEFFLPLRQMEAATKEPSFRFMEVLDRALDNGLRDEYDYIVIDTPPALSYITMNAYWAADAILMPLPAEGIDLVSSAQFWSMFTSLASTAAASASKPKSFSWIAAVPSKIDHSKGRTKINLKVMQSAYQGYLLGNVEIPESAAIGNGGVTLNTVYDMESYAGSAKTNARPREAFDRLCEEVDYLTRLRKWGQTPEDIERDLQGASNSNTGA